MENEESLVITGDSVMIADKEYQLISTPPATTWSSSDDEVASVDSTGKVMAKSEGDCVITASSDSLTGEFAVKVVTKSDTQEVKKDETLSLKYLVIDKCELEIVYGESQAAITDSSAQFNILTKPDDNVQISPGLVYDTELTILITNADGGGVLNNDGACCVQIKSYTPQPATPTFYTGDYFEVVLVGTTGKPPAISPCTVVGKGRFKNAGQTFVYVIDSPSD